MVNFLINKLSLCAINRNYTSILCGKCNNGYSEIFLSTACSKCNNNYWWLFFPFSWALFTVYYILLINIKPNH